jgi:hypothetical protein
LAPNGELVSRLPPNYYRLELRDIPPGCEIRHGNQFRSVRLAAADAVDVEFQVRCPG